MAFYLEVFWSSLAARLHITLNLANGTPLVGSPMLLPPFPYGFPMLTTFPQGSPACSPKSESHVNLEIHVGPITYAH